MLFFFKPKPLTVHFFTAREEVFLHAKPQKTAHYFPDWVKNLSKPKFSDNLALPLRKEINIKSCPGLIDLYKNGFVFPLWSELNVEVDGNNWRYQFVDDVSSADPHPISQFEGAPFINDYIHLKLNNPWALVSDADVNLFYTAPSWNGFGFNDIVVAPGACNANKFFLVANINLFFKKQKDRVVYELPFGQPLVHVLPATERKLILKHELISEKELRQRYIKSGATLFGTHKYRKILKLCPHAK